MTKKPLLLIEPFAFIPTNSGGKNRILHTVGELSKKHSLEIVTFFQDELEKNKTVEYLKNLRIPYFFFKTRSKSNLSFIMRGIPYWFSDWYSPEILRFLKTKNYKNAVSIEFTQLLFLVNAVPESSKKIFTAHDISTVSFWRRLKSEPNIIKKIIGFLRLIEVYIYERRYLPLFDLIIAVTNHDAQILKKHFRAKEVVVVSNGIAGIKTLPPRVNREEMVIGFIGLPSHPPNLEAINFLNNYIKPELIMRKNRFRIVIAGEDGYIENIEDFYRSIDVLVAPLFAGSGSRIKILESLSYGRPVVTTQIGAEGIEVKSPLLHVVQDPRNISEWAEAIKSIDKKDDDLISTKLRPFLWSNTLSLIKV